MTTDDIKRNLIHFRYRILHAIIKGQIFYEEPPNCRGHAQVPNLLTPPIDDFQSLGYQPPAPDSLPSPSASLVGSKKRNLEEYSQSEAYQPPAPESLPSPSACLVGSKKRSNDDKDDDNSSRKRNTPYNDKDEAGEEETDEEREGKDEDECSTTSSDNDEEEDEDITSSNDSNDLRDAEDRKGGTKQHTNAVFDEEDRPSPRSNNCMTAVITLLKRCANDLIPVDILRHGRRVANKLGKTPALLILDHPPTSMFITRISFEIQIC